MTILYSLAAWPLGCAERLTLALLVPGVVTDDANDALAPNHLALVANLFDGRTNLHDALPKTLCLSRLLVSVRDATPARIIGTDFDGDSVTGENTNVELAHPSTDRRENNEPVVTLHAEHGVRKGLLDDPIELELIALRLFPLTTFTHQLSLFLPLIPRFLERGDHSQRDVAHFTNSIDPPQEPAFRVEGQ